MFKKILIALGFGYEPPTKEQIAESIRLDARRVVASVWYLQGRRYD